MAPKENPRHLEPSNGAFMRSLRITLLYFLMGALWILVTEAIVVVQLGEFTTVSLINIVKGLVYVLITALLLFAIVFDNFRKVYAMNEKLKTSEASLLEAQRLAHIGSYVFDARSGRVQCTDEVLQILDIPPEAFGGCVETLLDCLRPQDREALVASTARNKPEEQTQEMILHTVREHGQGRVVRLRYQRRFEGGRMIGSTGTLQDITAQHDAETALQVARDRAEMYLDIAAVLFLVVDRQGTVTLINRAGCETLGYTRAQIIGRNWAEHFVPDTHRAESLQLLARIKTGSIEGYEIHESRIVTASAEQRDIVWRNAPLYDDQGAIAGILSAGVDVTELKKATNALVESERSKAMLLANLPGMAFRCLSTQGFPMVFASGGSLALTGYPPAALVGGSALMYNALVCTEYRELLLAETLRALTARAPLKIEYEIQTAEGERKWVLQTSQGIYSERGEAEAIEGIVVDINESKRHFLRIQYLSDHDTLTELYNRQYYERAKARAERERPLPLTVLFADINGLKLINDAFGIEVGDHMIRKTGEIIQRCCREGDVVARSGGDEFSILSPYTDASSAAALHQRIYEAFAAYNATLQDKAQSINLSIAHGVWEDGGASFVEVIRQTDDALARRKLLDNRSHHNAMLISMMATMFERSFETEEHAERIAALSAKIGTTMGLKERELDDLHLFSMLHDIGKIGIRDEILKKPAALTAEEWMEMKKHPEIGYRIASSTPELASVAEYILSHHERWDGQGYPRGIAGEEIPLLARILAVADAYDAMTEDRVYRKGIAKDEAIAEIVRHTGTQFDPSVVEIFRRVIE